MKVNSLQLENYRCFEKLSVDFHDHLTVVVGANGAGKTTVLDTVSAVLNATLPPMNMAWNSLDLKTKDIRRSDTGGYFESSNVASVLDILGKKLNCLYLGRLVHIAGMAGLVERIYLIALIRIWLSILNPNLQSEMTVK